MVTICEHGEQLASCKVCGPATEAGMRLYNAGRLASHLHWWELPPAAQRQWIEDAKRYRELKR